MFEYYYKFELSKLFYKRMLEIWIKIINYINLL